MSSCSLPIPDEIDIADNNFTGGLVIVSIVGDVVAEVDRCDGKVDMRDVGFVAKGFMAKYDPSDEMYRHTIPCRACPHSPNFDIDGDLKIDMRDVGIAAKHF
jgi:hypothetical protein